MTDCIEIEGMEFYAYHGCYETEQIVGNKFSVDLYIEADCKEASETDDLIKAVNYQRAYELIKDQMHIKSHLLEHVCKRILDTLYENFDGIQKAKIKVSKMNPPMGGKIEKVSVSLCR